MPVHYVDEPGMDAILGFQDRHPTMDNDRSQTGRNQDFVVDRVPQRESFCCQLRSGFKFLEGFYPLGKSAGLLGLASKLAQTFDQFCFQIGKRIKEVAAVCLQSRIVGIYESHFGHGLETASKSLRGD